MIAPPVDWPTWVLALVLATGASSATVEDEDRAPSVSHAAAAERAPARTTLPGAPRVDRFRWADVDADGRVDALVLRPDGTGVLLRNRGDGSFEDRTQRSGLADLRGLAEALWGDVDADGRVDLALVAEGALRLFRQSESGTFADATEALGLAPRADVLGAQWTELDGDGRLDLLLTTSTGSALWRQSAAGFVAVDLGLDPQAAASAGARVVVAPAARGERAERAADGPDATRAPEARRPGAPSGPGGTIPTAAASGSASAAGTGTALAADGICAPSVADQGLPGNCLEASSVPTIGWLYPMSEQLNVDPVTGNVGINKLGGDERLHVNGDARVTSNSDASDFVGSGALQITNTAYTEALAIDSNEIQSIGTDLAINPDNLHATSVNGVVTVSTDGKVGIGTSPEPAVRVQVDVPPGSVTQPTGFKSVTDWIGLEGRGGRTGVLGTTTVGKGVHGIGGDIGVFGQGLVQGILGLVTGTGGRAIEGDGADLGWSGWFKNGDAYFEDAVGVGTETIAPDAAMHVVAPFAFPAISKGIVVESTDTGIEVQVTTSGTGVDASVASGTGLKGVSGGIGEGVQGEGLVGVRGVGTAAGLGAAIVGDGQDQTLAGWFQNGDVSVDGQVRAFGGLRLPTGAVAGHVLVSDASGNAAWAPPSAVNDDGDWTLSGPDVVRASGKVGVGAASPIAGVDARNPDPDGTGLYAEADTLGVRGVAYRTGGTAWGVLGSSVSPDGYGVFGDHFAGSGTGNGVRGRTSSPDGAGVRGVATAGGWGVYSEGSLYADQISINSTDTTTATFIVDAPVGTSPIRARVDGQTVFRVRDTAQVQVGDTNFTPEGKLHVRANTDDLDFVNPAAVVENSGGGTALKVISYGTDTAMGIFPNGTGRALRTFDTNGQPVMEIRNDGRVVTPVLEITGGADLVEGFETAEACEPGTVVVIDPERPGALRASDAAYDRKVAGVVSGAGGVQPGIRLGQQGVLDGDVPVAMSGRVWVRCSAENGVVAPGDRLTTAALAGHAMRASDAARCDGAVLGKAMTALDEGTGLVLVLVNLQ